MRKKIVMAVAAVAMAAVVSVSAFAADAVPSVRGGDENTTFIAAGQASTSETAQAALNAVQTTDGTVEQKLTAATSAEAVAEAVQTAGVESANALTVRKVGDVSTKDGSASLYIEGVTENTTVVVMYYANGVWHTVKATYNGSRVNFQLPISGNVPIMVLTKA